ncbi:hypothetical protein MF406_11260 [Georgenia sp. TF02-10]|uniref:hypothetical protein n=1 Tax=Georgenia sp. TF02-10 TaxID=2917725 RepID=UPI001FA71C3F|nr:hypothetical protein [Georgenia sp. TF02-10]UNX53566.1 hypothetical protein MF406_11260 [Georgenia sp. TF02-10]
MNATGDTPPLGYTPDPLEHHRVVIEFDVVARSADEAAYIMRETLIEDLAAPDQDLLADGDWLLGEPFDDDVPGIRRWKPAAPGPWLPTDLLALQTLRALVDPERSDAASPLLAPEERARLAEMLDAADIDVIVPDPDAPEEPPIYEGPASDAHNWIPAGVYDATGADGQGQLWVVVGSAPSGKTLTASAAFAHAGADRDAMAMNQISAVLDRLEVGASALRALDAISQIVVSSGRPGFDVHGRGVAHAPHEHRASLGDLLARRERNVDDDAPHPGSGRSDAPGRSL